MAGYKIFHGDGTADIQSKLREIGIQLDGSDGQGITFSDGTYVRSSQVLDAYHSFIADDEGHFIFCSPATSFSDAIFDNTDSTSFPYLLIGELIDGTMYAKDGKNNGPLLVNLFNISKLAISDNNSPVNELVITNLIGDPYSVTLKNIYKNIYINQQRWFQFGDVITTSNGDQYIGFGWFLHKIGG